MLVNSNIYNYLGSTQVPVKRNRTHKSSELKAIYNNMARYNKKSPRYLLSLSMSKQSQIINIKESAMTLRETADRFSDINSDIYEKKLVVSEDEEYVSGSLKTGRHSSLPEELSIQVDSLASEQTNTGSYLKQDRLNLKPGEYNLNIVTTSGSHKTVLTVSTGNTNLDIQKRLLQFINSTHCGIKCTLLTQGEAHALSMTSSEAGSPSTEDGLHFSFDGDSPLLDTLGLNNVTTLPANSEFKINGEPHASTSNHISINQSIELDFHKADSRPVSIKLIPDSENSLSQIEQFTRAYNSLLDTWEDNSASGPGCRNLFRDISVIAMRHKNALADAGLTVEDNGRLSYDSSDLLHKIKDGSLYKLFSGDASFVNDIIQSTERLTIDPIAYINKLIVTYPDSTKKSGSVYNKSLYSGLLYNNYA